MTDDPHTQPDRTTAKPMVRVFAFIALIGGAIAMKLAVAETDSDALFAVGAVLVVAALVAGRLPSLFWVPSPTRARALRDAGERDLAVDRQHPAQ
jgi:uncharacterized membrane protein